MGMEGAVEDDRAYYFTQKVKEFEQITENQDRMIEMLKRQTKHFEELSKDNMNKTNTMLFKYRSTEQELIRSQRILEKYEKDVKKLREENEKLTHQCNNSNDSMLIEAKKWKIKHEKAGKKVEELEKEKLRLREELNKKSKELSKEINNETEITGEMKMYQGKLEEKLSETQKELSNVRKELEDAEKEVKNLRQLGAESLQSLEHLINENKALQSENQSLKRHKESSEINNAAEMDEIKQLKQSVENAAVREQAKERTMEELQKQNDFLRKEIERVRDKNNVIEDLNQFQYMKDMLLKKESEIECLTHSVKMEIEQKNMMLSNYLRNTEILNGELSVAQNIVEELSQENRSLKNTICSVKNDASESCNTFNEAEVQAEIENSQKECRLMQESLSELKAKNGALEKDLEGYKILLGRLKAENCSLQYDKIQLQSRCSQIREAHSKNKLIIDQMQDRISGYESAKSKFERTVSNLESSNKELFDQLNKLQTDKDAISDRIDGARKNVSEIESRMLNFKSWAEQFVVKVREMKNLSQNNDLLKKEYDLTLSKLKLMQNEYQLKINELDIFNKRNMELRKINADNGKCIAILRKDKEELQDRLRNLEADKKKVEEELLLKSQQIQNIKLEHELKQFGVRQFEQANDILLTTLQQLSDEIENNSWQIRALEEDVTDYKVNLKHLLEQVDRIAAASSKSKASGVEQEKFSKHSGKEQTVTRSKKDTSNIFRDGKKKHLTELLGKLNKNNLELKFVIHLLRKDGQQVEVYRKFLHKDNSDDTGSGSTAYCKRMHDIGISTELVNTEYEFSEGKNENGDDKKRIKQIYRVSEMMNESCFTIPIASISTKSISTPNINKSLHADCGERFACAKNCDNEFPIANANSSVSNKTLCLKKCPSTNSVDSQSGPCGLKNIEYIKQMSISKNMEYLEAERERWWSNMKTLHELRSQVQDIKSKLTDTKGTGAKVNRVGYGQKEVLSSTSLNNDVARDKTMPTIIANFQDQMKKLLGNKEVDCSRDEYNK